MHDEHPEGLAHDLQTLMKRTSRRQLLRFLGGASLLPLIPLVGCGGGDDADTTPDAGTGADASGGGDGTCAKIPEETAGPYPGDGSNGANALSLDGVVRRDIRSSFAGATGVAAGVPLTVKLKLVNISSSCASLAGYAVYLWHCDRDGNYSMYSTATAKENYLRGVQLSDDSGVATFTTIFPGCYSGRMPHIHFEVFPQVSTSSAGKVATSQIAFPTDVCNTVYATSGYSASVSNLSRISFSSDNVFSDGVTLQLATMSGSVADGYTAELSVGVKG